METRQLGKSGLGISVLTFGCWQAGGKDWAETDDEKSLEAMKAALDCGINFFDTAEGYGGGHSEEIVGRFLQDVGRDNVLVATKVSPNNLTPEKVRASCDKSLKRLGLEQIALYQIHWPAGAFGSPIVPVEGTMEALVELQNEGKIAAIGVSNFNAEQIEEAQKFGRIDSLQPPYSLFFQPYVEDGTVEFCRSHDIGVIPYSPLAQGLVTGKFSLENRPSDVRANNGLFQDPIYPLALEAVEKMKPLAEKYDTGTTQLALAWLLAQPGVTSPIVGARNPQQIRDTATFASLHLDEADIKAISDLAQPILDKTPEGATNMWKME